MYSRCTFDCDEPARRLNQFSRSPWRLRSFTIQNDSRENDRTCLSDSYIIYLNLSATIDLHDSLCHLSPVENHSIATIFLRFDRFVSSCLFRYFFPFFHQSIISDAAASNTRNARVILDIIRALPERTRVLCCEITTRALAFYDFNTPRGVDEEEEREEEMRWT